jgi:hypothetical protein
MRTLARSGDRAALLRRLQTIQPDSVRRWGRMSAHEMVCHLSDGFRMATGGKAVSDATSSFHRTVVKWIALYAPVPWPSGIMTRPEIEQGVGGTCPGDFAADVEDLARRIDTFARGLVSAAPNLRSPQREGVAPVGIPARRSPPSSVRRIAAHTPVCIRA